MNSVEIYVDGRRLDLYPNENINMNIATQSIGDISKSFADFSQAFTVPATDNNNDIFKHYYNADVSGGFDAHNAVQSHIDIGGVLFRTGEIELESVNLKDMSADSYSLTFYAEVAGLKNIFGEDLLSDIDMSAYNFEYNSIQVAARMLGTGGYDIVFPFIFRDKQFHFNPNATQTNQSTFGLYAEYRRHKNGIPMANPPSPSDFITYSDLEPAIRLRSLFDAIEAHYGVQIGGNLLDDTNTNSVANKLHMHLHKPEDYLTTLSQAQEVGFSSIENSDFYADYSENILNSGTLSSGTDVGADTSAVNLASNKYVYNAANGGLVINMTTNLLSTDIIDVNMFINGVYFSTTTISGSGAGSHAQVSAQTATLYANSTTLNTGDEITFRIKANPSSQNNTANIWRTHLSFSTLSPTTQSVKVWVNELVISLASGDLDVTACMPNTKVTDFITGIMKMYNAVLQYNPSTDTYELNSLGAYWDASDSLDFTQYIDTSTAVLSKPELWSKLNFGYKGRETAYASEFFAENDRGWGNLDAEFAVDGKSLDMQIEFENVMWWPLGVPDYDGDVFQDPTSPNDLLFNAAYCFDRNEQETAHLPILFYNKGGLKFSSDYSTWYTSLTNYIYGFSSSLDNKYYRTPYVALDNSLYADEPSNGAFPNYGLTTIQWGQSGGTDAKQTANVTQSLNFYAEAMPEHRFAVISDTLYTQHWQEYIENVYDPSTRKLEVKAVLPLDIMLNLNAQSVVVIRDRKYIVDKVSMNLNTGETKLTLINNADGYTALPTNSLDTTNEADVTSNPDVTPL